MHPSSCENQAESARKGGRPEGQSEPAGQMAAGGQPGSYFQSIDMQIAMLAATIVATVLAIIVLQGIKDQQEGLYPCKDYSFIEELPKLSTAILAAAALYFLYLAWREHQRDPDSSTLTWLFIANAFAVGAAVVKLDVLYLSPDDDDEEIEDIIEEVVE